MNPREAKEVRQRRTQTIQRLTATNLFRLPPASLYEIDSIVLLGNEGVEGDIFD